jgi:predicted N-acetyltransferase YhbS
MSDLGPVELERAPVSSGLANELAVFWESSFGTSFDETRDVLGNGIEVGRNRDTVWCLRRDLAPASDEVAGLVATCQLTVPVEQPELGGLGGVATAEDHRRQGLAERLCREARDLFCDEGGEALFLGTVDPLAARIYRRLGWSRLAGSTVHVHVSADQSPEEFLVDWFRDADGSVTVKPGTARARIPMIPLLLTPHTEQVLDANLDLVSIRYARQDSCMGLYPGYANLSARRTGQTEPADNAALVRCALESLALKYRDVLEQIETLTGETSQVVHVVGGGSQNELLNQFTANACDRSVVAGPVEATAFGNVLVQARANGELESLADIRQVVANSTGPHTLTPNSTSEWDDARSRFHSLCNLDN